MNSNFVAYKEFPNLTSLALLWPKLRKIVDCHYFQALNSTLGYLTVSSSLTLHMLIAFE